MATHEFRLEQVLKFRKEVERNHQLELAAAKQQHDHAREELAREKSALHALEQRFKERQRAGMDGHELQLYSDFSARKTMEIHRLRASLAILERTVHEKLEALQVAAKEKKALEIFKEKQLRQFRQHQLNKERDFMDEISIQKGGQQK